jgi:5-methylcytosine-specific restriction endonuclease McrA
MNGNWKIDYIWPISEDGSTNFANLQVLSNEGIKNKADKLEGQFQEITWKVYHVEKDFQGKIIGSMKTTKIKEK